MRFYGVWSRGNTFVGTSHEDEIYGGGRNDVLLGREGNDTIVGYDGDDRLEGGPGMDILDGGPGRDRASYEHAYEFSHEGVFVDLATGRGHHGDAEGDRLYGIEDLFGTPYNDALFGDDRPNEIWGDAGIDNIRGGDGPDHLHGGAGDDRINGGGNNFSFDFGPMFGGTLSFMAGDVLDGLSGADTFIWTRITDTGTTPEGMDHILDFNRMDGDRIDLNAIDADTTVGGYQPFTFIDDADFWAPGQVQVTADGTDFIVSLNTDTDYLDAEAAIRVSMYPYDPHTVPDSSWFVPWVADHPL
jgi:Ca2+-binding RTX toxin-like protein